MYAYSRVNSDLWYAKATHASLRLMRILAYRMEHDLNTFENILSSNASFTDGLYTKGTRAQTHSQLIREWLREPKRSSLEYI